MAKGDQLSLGSDYQLTIPLKNNDGTAMNLSSATGITVALVQGKKKVIHRYSIDAIGNGFETGKLEILSAAGGTLTLYLEASVTAKCEPGDLYYRAEVQLVDANFTNSRSNTESGYGLIGEMIPGTTKQIDINA